MTKCLCGSPKCGVSFWRKPKVQPTTTDGPIIMDADYCAHEFGSRDYEEGFIFGVVATSVVWLLVSLALVLLQ